MTCKSQDEFDATLYRPNVGIIVLNPKNQVFMAQRIDTKGPALQMPQGGIDAGEDVLEAATRELLEETSLRSTQLLTMLPGAEDRWYVYDFPEPLQKKLWSGLFYGQRQKWVVVRFLGSDSEVNIETDHPEFLSWQWVDLDDVVSHSVDFKRDIYQAVIKDVKHYLSSIS